MSYNSAYTYNFKKGDIVMITKSGPYDPKGEYTGFISEIIVPPRFLGNCWNFTMLYGNAVRKEYSELYFYHDPSALKYASEKEIRVYKAMKAMRHNNTDRSIIPLSSKRKGAINTNVRIGQDLYNLYEDGIYASGYEYPNIMKIYDIDTGKFAPGIPREDVECFNKNIGYTINTTKTIKMLDLETEGLDMFAIKKAWDQKSAAATKGGSKFHQMLEHEMNVMNPILLLDNV